MSEGELSAATSPDSACVRKRSNSFSGNDGSKRISDINVRISFVCFVSPDPRMPFGLALIDAPRKSMASSSSAFDVFFVPERIISPNKSSIPALFPSKMGAYSKDNVQLILGCLWFSTTISFKPLSKVKSLDSPSSISGAGPGSGA